MKEKKREILMMFSYWGVGGAQQRAITLANSFSKSGYKVSILSVLGNNNSANQSFYDVKDGIMLVDIPNYSHKNRKHENGFRKTYIRVLKHLQPLLKKNKNLSAKYNDKIRGIKNSEDLRAYMTKHRGALVIVFGFNIYERCYYACKGLGCKMVYAETNAKNKFVDDRNYDATVSLIEKADMLVFQTQKEKEDFITGRKANAEVVYNPIKNNLPEPYFGEREKIIVNFCALKEQKNLLLLIQAFELLRNEHPEYSLHLYSDNPLDPDNAYRRTLLSYIADHSLENHVFLLPMRNDIHSVIRNKAMFVSSSDYEGLSNSMIEAMALGLPCVCTDCDGGGAREMIENGINGILVPKGDCQALYIGMKKIIEDSEFAKACGQNSTGIREKLDTQIITSQWLRLIERIIN